MLVGWVFYLFWLSLRNVLFVPYKHGSVENRALQDELSLQNGDIFRCWRKSNNCSVDWLFDLLGFQT